MKHTYTNAPDYFATLLSVFDIGGSMIMSNRYHSSRGIHDDTNRLMQDQKILEQDYRQACEKIAKSMKLDE